MFENRAYKLAYLKRLLIDFLFVIVLQGVSISFSFYRNFFKEQLLFKIILILLQRETVKRFMQEILAKCISLTF